MKTKPILCVDFDGTLHPYTRGWFGAAAVQEEPPVPGALEFLRQALKHFRVAIFSSRSHQPGGITAMRAWLYVYAAMEAGWGEKPADISWVEQIEWPTEKPAAMISLDDRALTFDGTWPSMETLLNFKPWNKREGAA